MNLEFSRQIVEGTSQKQRYKPRIKFHENPSNGSLVVPCCRADMTKLKSQCFERAKRMGKCQVIELTLRSIIPYNNPDNDIRWKTQLYLSNRKNRSAPTSATIRERN